MIREEELSTLTIAGAAGNLTDFAFDDCHFKNLGHGFKFVACAGNLEQNILITSSSSRLVDAVLIDAFENLAQSFLESS